MNKGSFFRELVKLLTAEECRDLILEAQERLARLGCEAFHNEAAWYFLGLSVRASNGLKWLAEEGPAPDHGLARLPRTCAEVAEYGEARLLRVPNMGRKSVLEIKQALADIGLTLKP